MKALVGSFKQVQALVGAFSVITNLRMDFFEALPESQQLAGECGGLRLDLCPAHFLRWLVVLLRYQWVPFMFSHQLLGARSGRSQGCGSWVTSPPTAATAAKVHSFSLQTGNNE